MWKRENLLRALAAAKVSVGVKETARTHVPKTTLKRGQTGKAITSVARTGHPNGLTEYTKILSSICHIWRKCL